MHYHSPSKKSPKGKPDLPAVSSEENKMTPILEQIWLGEAEAGTSTTCYEVSWPAALRNKQGLLPKKALALSWPQMTLNEITAKLFPNQINSEIKWVEKLSKLSLSDVVAKRDVPMWRLYYP